MKYLILLYPLFFLLVFLWGKDKRSHLLYNIIVLIYFFAGLSSVYICFYLEAYKNLPITIGAILYQLFLLFLLLKPIRLYDERGKMPLLKPNTEVHFFTIFIIGIILVYFFEGIQNVSMERIMIDVQGLREELIEQEGAISFFGYIAFVAKQLSVVPVALMFYYMVNQPERKILICALFLCGLAFPFVELQFAAREYLIKYLFVLFCLYMCIKDKLSQQWKKTVKFYGIITAVPILSIFFLITFQRFGDTSDSDVTNSLFSYFGQGYAYFTEAFLAFPDGMSEGSSCFPIFGGSSHSAYNVGQQVYSSIHFNVFRTTIGSWLLDCGWLLTIIITIIYFLLFRKIGMLRYHNAFTLIYMGWVYDFIFQALFFFHSRVTGTSAVVYLFVIFIDFLSRRNAIASRTYR